MPRIHQSTCGICKRNKAWGVDLSWSWFEYQYCYECNKNKTTSDLHDQESKMLDVLLQRHPSRIWYRFVKELNNKWNSHLLLFLLYCLLAWSWRGTLHGLGFGFLVLFGSLLVFGLHLLLYLQSLLPSLVDIIWIRNLKRKSMKLFVRWDWIIIWFESLKRKAKKKLDQSCGLNTWMTLKRTTVKTLRCFL